MKHTHKLFVLAVMACSATAVWGLISQGYPPKVDKQVFTKIDYRGLKAPEIKDVRLVQGSIPTDLEGKVLLIEFTRIGSSGTAPEENTQLLKEFQKKFKNDILILSLYRESYGEVQSYIKQHNLEHYVGSEAHQLFDSLGVSGRPLVFVVSADGIVRWQGAPNKVEVEIDYDDDKNVKIWGLEKDPLTETVLKQIIDANKANNPYSSN